MKIYQVMIVSKPGSWQKILASTVSNYPFLEVSEIFSGSLTASEKITEIYPAILLIDSTISIDDAITLVAKVKSKNSWTKIIVVVDTEQQRNRFELSRADYIVSSYALESELRNVFQDLGEDKLDLPEAV